MRRLHIAFTVELGEVSERPPREAGPDLDALVEHGDPDPHHNHELDGRRRIGFAQQEDRR